MLKQIELHFKLPHSADQLRRFKDTLYLTQVSHFHSRLQQLPAVNVRDPVEFVSLLWWKIFRFHLADLKKHLLQNRDMMTGKTWDSRIFGICLSYKNSSQNSITNCVFKYSLIQDYYQGSVIKSKVAFAKDKMGHRRDQKQTPVGHSHLTTGAICHCNLWEKIVLSINSTVSSGCLYGK